MNPEPSADCDAGLFNEERPYKRHASLSEDGLYRWSLHREWRKADERPRWVTFVMLNPSTADANIDDPTIVRCKGFAESLGCTGLAVVNLYAYRATSPKDLWKAPDPVGRYNDTTLTMFLAMAREHDFPIVAAWGANAKPERVATVMAMPGSERLTALHVTKAGAPGHPLYLPATARPMPWPTTVTPPEGSAS